MRTNKRKYKIYRLKKDLIIPTGTILDTACTNISFETGSVHCPHVLGGIEMTPDITSHWYMAFDEAFELGLIEEYPDDDD